MIFHQHRADGRIVDAPTMRLDQNEQFVSSISRIELRNFNHVESMKTHMIFEKTPAHSKQTLPPWEPAGKRC